MTKKDFLCFIENLQDLKIVVIGDMMLDRFVYGNLIKISQEAPVPVFLKEIEKDKLGGSANVVHNLKELGCKVYNIGVIGTDNDRTPLCNCLRDIDVSQNYLWVDNNYKTTVKTRYIAQNQQIFRMDEEKYYDNLKWSLDFNLLEILKSITPDCIIISDYAKGVINQFVIDQLNIYKKYNKDVFISIDPHPHNDIKYINFDLFKPNINESLGLCKIKEVSLDKPFETNIQFCSFLEKLSNISHSKYTCMTMGNEGMILLDEKGAILKYSKITPMEVFDVCGAGDTVISFLTLLLSQEFKYNFSFSNCLDITNIAANIVIRKLGTSTVSIKEITEKVLEYYGYE